MNLSNVQFLAPIVAATVLIVPRALANQLEAYCISQVGQKWEEKESPFDKLPLVSVTVQGETFHITDRLQLIRPGEETPLAWVYAEQDETSHINDLVLGEDGWLWIDGAEIDYMVSLDLSTKPPTLGNPVAVPELYSEPCPQLAHFWGGCPWYAQSIYSPSLNRVFISGHRVSFFGRSSPVGFEMYSGKAQRLPAELKRARFLADLPKLNGVLFRGSSNEAFFYDGVTVTTLLGSFPPDASGNNRPPWIHQSTQAGRTFLISNIRYEKDNPFILELKAGPMLVMPFSFPKEEDSNWFELFTLANDSRIWGVLRHKVVAEVAGNLQTVVTVAEPYYISGPGGVWQTDDGSIAFGVKNQVTGISTNYYIRQAGPSSQCQTTLSVEEPMVIGGD